MRKGITSSRQQTLSGEAEAWKKKSRQGHDWKGRVTWPGIQQI